jgi:phthalate 4,5-cis-dihydrodiol dehydrogenase
MFAFLSRVVRGTARTAPRHPRDSIVLGAPERLIRPPPLSTQRSDEVNVTIRAATEQGDAVRELAGDPGVDAIQLASTRRHLVRDVKVAADGGKHVLLELSTAPTPADLEEMVGTCKRAGVQLLAAHTHSYDALYLQTRAALEANSFGQVRLLQGLSYSDDAATSFASGNLDQLQVQTDVVRLLTGSPVARVRLLGPKVQSGSAPRHVAMFWLQSGAMASMTYGGAGGFDSDEWIGATTRQGLPTGPQNEMLVLPRTHAHSGPMIVSCDNADLRPMPDGIAVYEDRHVRKVPIAIPARSSVEGMLWELHRWLSDATQPRFDGAWARDTQCVCAALRQSREADADVWLADGRIAQTRPPYPPFMAPS